MRSPLLLVSFLLFSIPAFSQGDKKKWDVSNPEGIPFSNVEFTLDEGTWMNLDVSPDGQTIAFDLLGDIYTMPAAGGDATCVRSGIAWEVQPRFSPDGAQLLFTSDAGGGDNIWVMQTDGSKARQVTKENFRLLNNPCWMPDGQYFVARKHFTSTRSLGAGEIWMYHLSGGEGIQLTKRKNDQQDVNEPSVSSVENGRYVYYSEDVYDGGFFQYNKDPLKQIFVLQRYDRREGKVQTITGGSGGACRPQISPDGKWLAFVRRVDTKTVLFLHELATGLEYPLYDGLDKDQQEAWTTFGCYPGFAWGPDRLSRAGNMSEIFIWAGGKIKRVNFHWAIIEPNDQNTRADRPQVSVSDVPFRCTVKSKVAETLRFENKVFEPEFTARAIRQAATSPNGKILLFNAAGLVYYKLMPDGPAKRLTDGIKGKVTGPGARENHFLKIGGDVPWNEFEPSFSADGKTALFVLWWDEDKGAIARMNLETKLLELITPPQKGIFRTPAFSPDGTKIVFRLQNGDDELGPGMTDKPGIYIMDADGKNQRFVTEEGENPRFSSDGTRILVNTGGGLFGGPNKTLVSFDLNGQDRKELFKNKYATQWAVSPDGNWLAFTELHKAYVCAIPRTGQTVDLGADTKAIPVSQIAKDAGYNLHWSGDSKRVHYTLGDEYFTIELGNLFTFLPGAPDSLPALPDRGQKIGLNLKADSPAGAVVFQNARIITMEGDRVIENGGIL